MRPGFIGSFPENQSGASTPPAPVPPTLTEAFEYAGSWPGTIPNVNYYLTYVINPTASLTETFEASGGWPGTT